VSNAEASTGSAFSRLSRRALFGEMHEQLDELLAGRDQMESLLRVIVGIGGDLDLNTTLHRIIDAAIELTGSRYGALGVRGPDGMLDAFLFKGIGAELQARIGHLPVGKGVLGVLLDRAEPLRVDDLTQHPAAVGFPEHHPPMRAFLGMPIVIRSEVYGTLYVTDDRAGHVFGESDENAIRALGAAAGVAIDNARLFERERASARWITAGREITSNLLSAAAPERPLQMRSRSSYWSRAPTTSRLNRLTR
jgi:GAF domain-containing protein